MLRLRDLTSSSTRWRFRRSRTAATVETTVEAVVTVRAEARRHGKSIETSALRLRAAERCAGSHAVWLELTDNLVGASSPWA
jgi:hypothetical protein